MGSSIGAVLLVEYRGGELVYDPYREDAPLPVPQHPFPILCAAPVERRAPSSMDEVLPWVEQRWQSGSVLVNADHAVSYAGLSAWAKRSRARRGLIVVDQHLDAYSLKHTGSRLNKANFLRYALSEGLVEAVACVGARSAEVAMLEGRADLVPEEHRLYVQREHREGVFGGLAGRATLYPAARFDLASGLSAALEHLSGRGIEELGLDLDLDAFDSQSIVGVDYNPDWSSRVLRFVASRIAEKRIPPALEDWLAVLHNVALTQYEISEPGLEPQAAPDAVRRLLAQAQSRGLTVPLRAVSEFEPAFDDGRTARLAAALIETLREHEAP